MTIQARVNVANIPDYLTGVRFSELDAVIAQDGARAIPLARYTVMAKIAATKKWVPFISVALTTGASLPLGIYNGDAITAAAMVAGDVVDVPIVVGGTFTIDVAQLVFDGGTLDLDDILDVGTVNVRTVKDQLATFGLFTEATVAVSGFENA